ncbi:hypothetical protein [Moorena producens]|uniref:hypothetical protein n=1 Tax=Moorena producens TaxID=1155739 RepID=UPI0011EA6AB7|nr:hypothetical protein [Moorena producens]
MQSANGGNHGSSSRPRCIATKNSYIISCLLPLASCLLPYYGIIAKTLAGKPEPFRGLGNVTIAIAPYSGT